MHPLLRAAAERQSGLFSAQDARRAGYEHPEVRRLCSSGTWIRLRRGVYVEAGRLAFLEDTGRRHEADCLAVLLELRRKATAVSHESAARLWKLPVPTGAAAAVRLTDPALSRQARGYQITQAPLRTGEVWRKGPLRLTSASRTLLDCARSWALEDAVVALDAALLAGTVTGPELTEGVAALRGWHRARRAARAVELADGRAESPLETRGRLRIVGAGLPAPELQVEIRVAGRLVGVVDAWFDDAAVAVEFDGRVKYTDPRGEPGRVLWNEKRREDELRALDIRVLRLAHTDLGAGWPQNERRLRELLASRGPSVRQFSAVPRTRGVLRTG